MTDGYQPNWDIDLPFGEEGENTVRHLLALDQDRIEVKRKRRLDDWFYVETAHSPGATGTYVPSGINRTKADYWAYVVADMIFLFPTSLLRKTARDARQVEESDGDCPTKGRLVSLFDLIAISEFQAVRSAA